MDNVIHRYFCIWVGSEENKKENKMASNDATEKILGLLNQSPDALDALQRVSNTFSSVTSTKPDPGELFLTDED